MNLLVVLGALGLLAIELGEAATKGGRKAWTMFFCTLTVVVCALIYDHFYPITFEIPLIGVR